MAFKKSRRKRCTRKSGKKPTAKARRRKCRRGGFFGAFDYSTFNPMHMITKPMIASMKLGNKLASDRKKRNELFTNLANFGSAVANLRKMKM